MRGNSSVSATTNNVGEPQIFKTKEGFCLVFPDRIVFSKNESGVISDEDKKDYSGCVLFLFGFLALIFTKNAVQDFFDSRYFAGSAWLVAGLFCLFCTINNWNSRDATKVKRRDIVSMKLRKEGAVYRNSFVDLVYKRYGKKCDMRIELSGSLLSGDTEARKAVRILSDEKLLEGVVKSGIPYESIKIEYQRTLADFYETHPEKFDWAEISEIEELEKEMGEPFPKSYFEYLAIAGKGNRMVNGDIEFFPLSKLSGRNKELKKKARKFDSDFAEAVPFFTFAFKNGRYVYFRLDGGFDPKVYELLADDPENQDYANPVSLDTAFSDFIAMIVTSNKT